MIKLKTTKQKTIRELRRGEVLVGTLTGEGVGEVFSVFIVEAANFRGKLDIFEFSRKYVRKKSETVLKL